MNRFLSLAGSFVLFISVSACDKEVVKSTPYYPIDHLINSQVEYLSNTKAILTKHAEIEGSEESTTLTPKDSAAWANELDIFAELNVINSPGNLRLYKVSKGVKDSNSNLTVDSYTGHDVLPVVYLKIFYLDKLSQIRRIEALYQEENSLVKGSRLLIMEFQSTRDDIMLTSYSIEGSQKMFLGESVKFSVRGTISLP